MMSDTVLEQKIFTKTSELALFWNSQKFLITDILILNNGFFKQTLPTTTNQMVKPEERATAKQDKAYMSAKAIQKKTKPAKQRNEACQGRPSGSACEGCQDSKDQLCSCFSGQGP